MEAKVICLDDRDRPDDIPVSKWVVAGREYTAIDAIRCNSQPGQPFAIVLQEIDLTGCGAYKGFAAWRFMPLQSAPEEIATEALAYEGI